MRRPSVITRTSDGRDESTASDYGAGYNSQHMRKSSDLKVALQSLYAASIVGFMTQVQAGSNKSMYSNMKNKPIGRLPDFFKVDNASVDAVAGFRYAGNA